MFSPIGWEAARGVSAILGSVVKIAVITAVISALAPFHSSIKPVPNSVRAQVTKSGAYHKGCPVTFSDLRVLKVTFRGFDKHNHTGQLIVNSKAAPGLAKVFHRLYVIHFPIHHMTIDD